MANSNDPKLRIAILRHMRDARHCVGSAELARAVRAHGYEVSPRTVRSYLQEMEDEGLVGPARRGRSGGREITERGVAEIGEALVIDRVGFTNARIDTLTYRMDFDPVTATGRVVLNITLVDRSVLAWTLREMVPVFERGLAMGRRLLVAPPGGSVGEFRVPEGKAAIATVCSVTLNGALLSQGVPMVSRFAGLLDIHEHRPVRFTDVIYYDGTSLDPLEIFIKGGLTNVQGAAGLGKGRIGASFREVPTAAMPQVLEIVQRLDELGLGGVLSVGRPNQPLLEFPVHQGRTGLIVAGGLNPSAVLEESGFGTRNIALAVLHDYSALSTIDEVIERLDLGQDFFTQ